MAINLGVWVMGVVVWCVLAFVVGFAGHVGATPAPH
jgi:hypothetical protein